MVSKFAPFTRGAAAAKTLFTSSGNPQMPGFFVSTPQFNRQKSQVGYYLGDAHKHSFGLDPGAIAVGPSQAFSTAAATNTDDDDKDKQRTLPQVKYQVDRDVQASRTADNEVQADTSAEADVATAEAAVESIVEPVELVESDEITQLRLLSSQGRHTEVLELVDGLENSQTEVPITAYNLALKSLAELSLVSLDITPVLTAYERMINSGTALPKETFTIVLSCFVRMSELLEKRREQLRMLVGSEDSNIESIGEILESVAIEDHLKIAASILRAVKTQVNQDLYDQIVYLCCKYSIDVSDLVTDCGQQAPRILCTTSFEQAQEIFNQETATIDDKYAFMDICFKFGNPDAALALESSDTEEHLTVLLAKYGYVSTAWKKVQTQNISFFTRCQILELICSHNIMSTATLMFDNLIVSKKSRAGVWCSARSTYLKLCVRNGDEDMLFKAIKETQLRMAVWDPSTILCVTEALIPQHPQLAVEIFVQQTQRLQALWTQNDFKSFCGQELMTAFMEKLESPGDISVFCALILCQSPLVTECASARQKLFQLIWDARLRNSPQYVEFMSEAPETLANIINVHSDFILASESHFGIALPFDIQESLHKIYPLLVSDIMANGLPFSEKEAEKIEKCLKLLGVKTQPWINHCTSQEFTGNHCSEADEVAIKSYSNTPNGIDTAIELFERQLLLRKAPSGSVLRGIVDAIVRANDLQRLGAFSQQVLDRFEYFSNQTKIQYLRSFILTAGLDKQFAFSCLCDLKNLGGIPSSQGYAALIRVSKASSSLPLFNDAIAYGLGTSELYDAILLSLSRSGQMIDLERVFTKMTDTMEPTSETFKIVLEAFINADKEVSALGLMELMFKHKTGYETTTHPYNKLLEYYVFKKQDRKAALKIFAYMKNAGVILSPHSYKLLIETWLLKPMDLKKADRVLETMKLDQAVPSSQHFSTLLRARGVLDLDLESAQAFYRGLVKNSRVFPDQHIFAALVMSYVANGKSSDLPKVVDEMAAYRVNADNVAREIQRIK